VNYVIIGNSAAGIGTVEGIRKVDSKGRITLISDEPYHTYSRPLISYYLGGKVKAEKMYYREQDFYEKMNVDVKLGVKVTTVDPAEKKVMLTSGEQVKYDKLMLATGGKPIVPEMTGSDLKGVFTFLKWDDVKAIENYVGKKDKVVIIGAGLIGLKAAEAMVGFKAEVKVVELANRVLSAILDEEAALIVQSKLEEQGISFYLNNTVEIIEGKDGKVTGVKLQSGEKLDCDSVIIAIGVIPNKGLAVEAGLEVNRGIIVDEHLQTSDFSIYAAGDVSEGYDTIYKQRRVLPILPNAYKQGFAAGQNMAGEEVKYPGGFAMNAIGFFGLSMITAGIIKPVGEEFVQIKDNEPERNSLRKIVLRDNKVVGYIALNDIDRMGIITGLMENEVDVESFKDDLLRKDFGYVYMPKDYRLEKLLGVKKQ